MTPFRCTTHRALLSAIVICAAAASMACAPWVHMRKTAADERVVYAKGDHFCAEPSPDVAKAVATATDLSSSLAAAVESSEIPAQGKIDFAGAFSRSNAESLAQLTERLATIQLLRDGLYRACEAYANGALSKASYSVILSRYDDTMITMLIGEFEAGNFGRDLAVLGTQASGSASAHVGLEDAQEAADAAQNELSKAQENVEAKETAVAAAKGDRTKAEIAVAACPAAGCTNKEDTKAATAREAEQNAVNELAAARAAQEKADADAQKALSALAQSSAKTIVTEGVGGPVAATVSGRATGLDHLSRLQRKYLENINSDAFGVACITQLADPLLSNTRLARLCEQTLPAVALSGAMLLREKSVGGASRMLEACSEAIDKVAIQGTWTKKTINDAQGNPMTTEDEENVILQTVVDKCFSQLEKLLDHQEKERKTQSDELRAAVEALALAMKTSAEVASARRALTFGFEGNPDATDPGLEREAAWRRNLRPTRLRPR